MDVEATPKVNNEGPEMCVITSYAGPQTLTMETYDESADYNADERPGLDQKAAPRMVRSSDHLNIAQKKQVEGTQSHTVIRVEHIVKIFTGDDEFIEGRMISTTRMSCLIAVLSFLTSKCVPFISVTPEQVDRVKKSKYMSWI